MVREIGEKVAINPFPQVREIGKVPTPTQSRDFEVSTLSSSENGGCLSGEAGCVKSFFAMLFLPLQSIVWLLFQPFQFIYRFFFPLKRESNKSEFPVQEIAPSQIKALNFDTKLEGISDFGTDLIFNLRNSDFIKSAQRPGAPPIVKEALAENQENFDILIEKFNCFSTMFKKSVARFFQQCQGREANDSNELLRFMGTLPGEDILRSHEMTLVLLGRIYICGECIKELEKAIEKVDSSNEEANQNYYYAIIKELLKVVKGFVVHDFSNKAFKANLERKLEELKELKSESECTVQARLQEYTSLKNRAFRFIGLR